MDIEAKRKAGKILNRGGISERIIRIAKEIADGTYKEAIEKAGQIKVLVESATYDGYWAGKAGDGIMNEEKALKRLLAKDIDREKLVSCGSNHWDS